MNYIAVGGGEMGSPATERHKCFKKEMKSQEKEEGLDGGLEMGGSVGGVGGSG